MFRNDMKQKLDLMLGSKLRPQNQRTTRFDLFYPVIYESGLFTVVNNDKFFHTLSHEGLTEKTLRVL